MLIPSLGPRRVLASLVFAALTAPAFASDAPPPDLRLGDEVVPLRQGIALRLDPAREDYSGVVEIELDVRQEVTGIRFHAEGLQLDELSLVPLAAAVSAAAAGGAPGEMLPLTANSVDPTVVEARAASPIPPGRYLLRIAFRNEFGTKSVGLYRTVHKGTPYLFTQMELVDAREAFPCWDEPRFKIPFRIALTVPPGLVAAGNSPVETEREEADGWRTVAFAETPPLPTYLLALAVGPFDVVPLAGWGVPARILTPRGEGALAATAAGMAPPMLPALERWFGQPYPFAKLDLVAVPEFWPGGMENPGLITFADEILLVSPDAVTPRWSATYAKVLAHELAHLWFGDLVTMRWWDDLWLNEAFADWLGDKVGHQVYPELGIDAGSLRGVQSIFNRDAHPSTPAIRRPVERTAQLLGDVGLAYAKGRSVLGMVESWLGEETFQRGVRLYLRRHAWGNAVGADLWNALGEASGQDVAAVLAGFLDQPGYPLIDVEVVDAERGRLRVAQHRFANAGVEVKPQVWRVPMGLTWSDGTEVHTRPLLLVAGEQEVELGTPVRWLQPNAASLGYYRWRMPPAPLAALVAAAPQALSAQERIGLLGNTSALVEAGALPAPELLGLLAAFAADPDANVAHAALDRLDLLVDPLLRGPLAEAAAGWVPTALAPALARIGEVPRPGESAAATRLRPRLLRWLGDQGRDAPRRAAARRLVEEHLDGRSPLDPTLGDTLVALAAYGGDLDLLARYRRSFEAATTPEERQRYLRGIGQFRETATVDAALAYTLTGPLRPDELLYVPAMLSRGGEGPQERVLAWLVANYDALAGRLTEEMTALLPMLATGCSRERLDHLHAALGEKVLGAEETFTRAGDEVDACVALRRREGEAVARWMAGEPAAAPTVPAP